MMDRFTGVIERKSRSNAPGWTPTKKPQGATRRSANSERKSSSLPDWSELDRPENRRVPRARRRANGPASWPTARTLTWLAVIGLLLTLYIGHVHSTKQLLVEVQELRQENLQLHLKYNRLRGEFQASAGPATVYDRARRLGLEEGSSFGPTIYIEE
jgi:cell division protein FtsL